MATLYTWSGNDASNIVQAVASLGKVNLSIKSVNPGDSIEGFPAHASAPCLSTKQGQNLTQLSSILNSLFDFGSDSVAINEWISFSQNVIQPAASAWVFPTLGAMPNNKGAIAEGKASLLASLEFLNSALATKTFLVGERPGPADAAVVGSLNLAFRQVLSEEYRKNIPHVVRWFLTCVNQPEFNSFGKTQLADKEAQFDAKVFGELNKKGKAPAKKQEKKAAAPKKEAKKEAAKPAEQAAAAPAPAKKGDPWAGLGGDMDMDAWKRCYSNNDTVPTAMDYFWKHFDKENYSCWFGKYKYGEEIPLPFMASNLIGGMYQRLDKMRKHSMGSMCVFNTAPNIEISGVMMWKGQGLAFELCDDWKVDYEVYDWKKLDTDNPEHRELITHYFAHEGFKDPNLEWKDGKVWK